MDHPVNVDPVRKAHFAPCGDIFADCLHFRPPPHSGAVNKTFSSVRDLMEKVPRNFL